MSNNAVYIPYENWHVIKNIPQLFTYFVCLAAKQQQAIYHINQQ